MKMRCGIARAVAAGLVISASGCVEDPVQPEGPGPNAEASLSEASIGDASLWSGSRHGVVFVSDRLGDGKPAIFIMDSDGSNVSLVTRGGTAGAKDPTWSPDGRWIAYSRLEATGAKGIDHISGISIVRPDGSSDQVVTEAVRPDGIPVLSRWPDWSFNDEIAFSRASVKELLSVRFRGVYDVMAVGVDGTGMRTITQNFGDNIQPAWELGFQPAIHFAHRRDIGEGNFDIWAKHADGPVIDVFGKRLELTLDCVTGQAGNNVAPDIHSDLVAWASDRSGNWEIYVGSDNCGNIRTAGAGPPQRLTHSPGFDGEPSWCTVGTIYFESRRDGNSEIYAMNSNGTAQRRVTDHPGFDGDPECRPTVLPAANASGPYSGEEGSAIQFRGTLLFRAPPSSWSEDDLSFLWDFGDGTTGEGPQPEHVYLDDGVYMATLTATDPAGTPDHDTAEVTIVNVAPSVEPFDGAELLERERYSADGSFTDPGADEWTAAVDYGDGTGTRALALDGWAFELDHVYESAGEHTVEVVITDDDGGIGTGEAIVVVLSPAQAASALRRDVEDTALDAALSSGETASLLALLDSAIARAEDGEADAAASQLRAFVSRLGSLVRTGSLSAEEAAPLAAYAERIIASLEG